MTLILDGKKARDAYKSELKKRVADLLVPPRLAILQIGNNPESAIYIRQKQKFGEEIGAIVDRVCFSETAGEEEIRGVIANLNADPSVHGVIIQLPVPGKLNGFALASSIAPEKDVDGLGTSSKFVPATAKGTMLLLDHYGIALSGKKAAVFGRSRLVGAPIAESLRTRGAEVSVIHSKTEHPEKISSAADIVIVAIGKAEYIDASFIKPGAVVVDVGINAIEKGIASRKLEDELPRRTVVGDVAFAAISPLVSAISPVPGGVGPMTVLALFDNLVVSAEALQAN
ncbi:MAG TPA: bifunctional 5,10-methylenetetrahydrofolate dehydrogenase/5,10-methenyltetrahydrofolate cyclohydrolase [Candidatus Paceibacterota bacterium]|nr:bifunctional 5,10-methylenetetrahydrofolate dehydrogenase/5,10-methenyltetrahydrofolate cyclohydrolase [Candidatus Paceibacterota bacterium]